MDKDRKLEWLARSGYAARGIVYVLIAGMASLSTLGGGEPDSKSALQIVLEQPFGQIWLGMIGMGLVGFVLWRVAQSILNTDRHQHNAKGYLVRAGLLVSAATYAGLAFYAIGQALHLGFGAGSSSARESWTAWLMQQPFGRYLVAGVALAIIGAGGAQAAKGVKRGYLRFFESGFEQRAVLNGICTYGLLARGVIFLIIGGFFIYAAFAVDPNQAGGLADALAWVRQLPFGAILYGMAAIGLFAFGLYGLIEARYRIVQPPSTDRPLRAMRSVVN
ncbi:DUF1206 domain-containing protein [Neorhizobium galegae]|uniref:DUF1206 domain-containing protein n=1 Tax=Neorhizobium galegae TaxID=399 RepID=UPI001281F62A|nr:DUF1206 domain-containing protein [Neorhizobium galegae]KAA9383678.1 DUF1206 domain-containing protein [Neorhizobium galegae]KAB1111806.1 DUF1206 domain-containing protein [Neorhizobium galegae]MCM2500888.1 DUF1206 domain-containing protein [Neorhizobium galegae]MCQ1769902.1 DUF1206 domain-containing protein [Neorhizobium galegae]MCQ1776042.1 DUF1206 domain-containing protein [Neorhizobium galegae]